MSLKPALFLPLATVTCALALASCGGDDKEKTSSPEAGKTSQPQTAPKSAVKVLELVDREQRVQVDVTGSGPKQTLLIDRVKGRSSISNAGDLVYSARGSNSLTLNGKCAVKGRSRDLASLYTSYLPQVAPGLQYTTGKGSLTWTIKPEGDGDFQVPKGVVETDAKGRPSKITVTQGTGFRHVASFSYPKQITVKQITAATCK